MVIGIRLDNIGTGIKAIGLGHRMPALVGGLLIMSEGNTLKVTGKEIAAGCTMTTTGTMIGTEIIARKSGVAVGAGARAKARIASSGGSNNPTIRVAFQRRLRTTHASALSNPGKPLYL
jgi:hypothetical protein